MCHFTRLTIVIIILLHLGFTISGDSAYPYYPIDDIAINCGSSGNSTALDGREWIGDAASKSTSSLYPKGKSTSSRALQQYLYADPVPYMYARFSRSQFTYTLNVSPGQKFIRLHFYPFSYMGFEASKSFFSVKVGAYTLLNNFSAFLTAETLGVKFFVKEFCVNVDDNQSLRITFSPSSSTNSDAFVNGIEVVSMPTGLYYNLKGDLGSLVVGGTHRFFIDNRTALETVHRLNIGGRSILPIEDLGMYRSWSEDRNYLSEFGAVSFRTNTMIEYSNLRTHVAPMRVYQTTWSMGPIEKAYEVYNLAWKLPVHSGFRYLVRLHFYELEFGETESVHRDLVIFINNQIAEIDETRIKWSGGSGCPVYRDYVVTMEGDRMESKRNLIIALRLKPKHKSSRATQNTALLNGLEIFKLSNPDNNLAEPNPGSMTQSLTSWTSKLKRLVLAFGGGNVTAVIITLVLTLVNIIVYQLNHCGTNSGKKNKSSPWEEKLCRRFSLMEIYAATKFFDDALVVGNGGFGKVYKGYIDHGALAVAIKRLKLESKQGALEFWTEIETLSTYRHAHLVSLIGFCDEFQEMILVYEYMAHGTLADHFHKIHNINGSGSGSDGFSLSWEQRLRICIGAARGLNYLHSVEGARHGLIHRDVKSSNILLDENWVAKISDFGLSKMNAANLSCTHISTDIKGTFGYLDPDYYMTRRLTSKSDVFAFGVVLFEVLCGRPAVDTKREEEQHSLVLWAKKCIIEGKLHLIVDPSLREQISPKSLKAFAEIANKCLYNHPNERPTMAEVVKGLEFELKRQESAYFNIEEEDSNEQISPASSTREVNMCSVEQTVAYEATLSPKSTKVSRMKKRNNVSNHGPNRGWRWDTIWHRAKSSWVPIPNTSRSTKTISSSLPSYLCRQFTLAEIKSGTYYFDDSFVISTGGFGNVYKGYIDNGSTIVAIKRLNPSSSSQGAHEFQNEILILSTLRHLHLVSLIGYCDDDGEMILVYDYMAHGTLRDHLYTTNNPSLTWKQRLKICIGVARGLDYLHTGVKHMIIHRDVKSTNILLDENWVAKVADFGLSKIGPTDLSCDHVSTVVKGSFGYLDPEYFRRQQLTNKSDVYSFGVVLFEVLCARPALLPTLPKQQVSLAEWGQFCYRRGTVETIVDSNLRGQIAPECLKKFGEIAESCLRDQGIERPSIGDVVRSLEFALQLQEDAEKNINGVGHVVNASWAPVSTSDDYNNQIFFRSGEHMSGSKNSVISTVSSDELSAL